MRRPSRSLVLLTFLSLAGMVACRDARQAHTSEPVATPAPMHLASPAFDPDGWIPDAYTCLGRGVSPPLAWSPPPEGTEAVLLTLERVEPPGHGTLLWVVYDLPPEITSLDEAFDAGIGGGVRGINQFGSIGYDGPCPPAGKVARYAFRVYALRTRLAPDLDLRAGLRLPSGDILGRGVTTGLFGYATRPP